ncbi:hypothetical protein [Stutzerimonas stutzeri]|uniref:hypothetical protein n=1 Tax=Stutzerimonas stutzeri TaxID=316 RepID=UPI0015E3316F|nr:hypothetical protein [Stutzerimonas stutzeri]
MTQLEQTIIANARQDLAAVLDYYQATPSKDAETDGDNAWLEYLCRYNAMNALLMLAHQHNSGLSPVGIQTLLEIEEEHAAAFRASKSGEAEDGAAALAARGKRSSPIVAWPTDTLKGEFRLSAESKNVLLPLA